MDMTAREAHAAEQAASAVDPAVRLAEYLRAELCAVSSGQLSTPANGDCAPNTGAPQLPDCEGAPPLLPLWIRERTTPTSPWTAWSLVVGASCPQDVVEFTAHDFARLPLAPPGLRLQPAGGEVLINVPTITIATAPEQHLTTTLLTYPIEVRATASSYTWTYGDGTDPVTTTSPGHPYPDHDVHHTYTRPGTAEIGLTVTWTGAYRLAGTTSWTPIPGTATTTATSPTITVVEAPTHLVADPCPPHAPAC